MSNYIIDSFTVKNYRSFYEEQTVNFDKNRPVIAFYGANASGKTNLYRAMALFSEFVQHSTDPGSHGVPYDPFLLRLGAIDEPTTFTVVFHNDENEYRYSISVDRIKVVEEEMYDLSSSRARTIFVRSKGSTELAAKNGFGKKMFEGNDAVRDDSLLITLAQRTKNKYANAVFDLLNNMAMITLTNIGFLKPLAVEVLQKQPQMVKKVLSLLREADFAIRDFSYNIVQVTQDPAFEPSMSRSAANNRLAFFNTTHAVRNYDGDRVGTVMFNMEQQESLGTNIFFCLTIMIIDAIENGRTAYLDEFGSSLHTNICKFVIKLFKREGKRTGAKLILNTHDTGLIKNGTIGVLGKDDIYIVEKDRFEQTIITPLVRKMRRSDDNIGKKYTMGLYGGVPILEEAD